MKTLIYFFFIMIVMVFDLTADEIDRLRIIKANVSYLRAQCLYHLDDLGDRTDRDHTFFFLTGHVNAYDDCLRIITIAENLECKTDLH